MDPKPLDSLESVWAHREEVIYPGLFGPKARGIFVLDAEIFLKVFRQDSIDPRWIFYGVFEFEPTEARDSWIYVTSGTSTPWEQEPEHYSASEYSGLGTELVFERPSLLQNVVLGQPAHFAQSFQLASGKVDLLQVAGITDAERDFAKEHGSDKLIERMMEHGAYPVTNPARESIVQ